MSVGWRRSSCAEPSSPVKKQMVIYDDTHPDEKVRVYDKGVEPAPNDARHLQISYRSGDLSVPKLENNEPLAELARHFLAVIRGKEKTTDEYRHRYRSGAHSDACRGIHYS